MARATVTRPTRSTDGQAVTVTNVTEDGVAFAFTAQTVLIVYNGSESAIDVTLQRPGTVDGDELDDKVVEVAAGAYHVFSALNSGIYEQSDGMCYVDFSATTSVWALVI